jgi:hypothetical protein
MPDLKPVEQMDAEELRVEVAERRGLSCATYMADGQILVVGCPDWPRDLNAAWSLADELIQLRNSPVSLCGDNRGWACFVDMRPTKNSKTASLAICRAWLTWKRGQEGEG